MGSKTLSLRDNRLKNFTTNKSNRMKFINETYKNKKELCTIYKLSKFRFSFFVDYLAK
jgi:hypothetical protein